MLVATFLLALLSWGAVPSDRTVAWIGKKPIKLSQVHREDIVRRSFTRRFTVAHHRPPILPADKAALDALRVRMELYGLGDLIQKTMREIEIKKYHVTLTPQDIQDATAGYYSGPQAQALVKSFNDQYGPFVAMIADVCDRGRSPDDAYRELTSQPPWKSMTKQQWEVWLSRLKTPQSRQEFLAKPATLALVQELALDAKLRWAIDAEIGKTNPDVARYAETEAGAWPNMTDHPVIPEAIIQARNEWWQKELARVGVRIVDPALKGALAETGPGL
jgi:hypothetical protein